VEEQAEAERLRAELIEQILQSEGFMEVRRPWPGPVDWARRMYRGVSKSAQRSAQRSAHRPAQRSAQRPALERQLGVVFLEEDGVAAEEIDDII
jgi:hypothetical protein